VCLTIPANWDSADVTQLSQRYDSFVALSWRGRFTVSAIVAVAFLLAPGSAEASPGAIGTPVSPQIIRQLDEANMHAESVCGNGHDGFDFATLAGQAVQGLRNAHMKSSPWNRLPRDDLVFECYDGLTDKGFLVDQKGHRSLAPPIPKATHCKRTATGTTCEVPYPGWVVTKHH
jgi:hypothetical protein